MTCGRIPDSDNLFRHCTYPLSFRGRRFAWDKLVRIYLEDDGSLLASLAWERFVPTEELLHEYGCRVALGMNEKLRAGGRTNERDRRIYCGAYQLKGRTVRALATVAELDEIASADVVHRVEDGEIAHTDLRIVLKMNDGLNIEDTKTAIVDRLASAWRGPITHTCDCDQDIVPHPSATLSIPFAGRYAEDRSYLRQRWHIFRFHVYNWLWRNSIRTAVPHTDSRSRAMRLWSTIKFHACRWLWRNLTGDHSYPV
jgi:hypothetical protein